MIVSKDRMAFLDPQEKIWKGESGKYFRLADVQNMSDTVGPFGSICDLAKYPFCNGTIFRFPLRTNISDLSTQCYDMKMMQELLDSLKEEAKYLLLFLRSVDTIETYNVDSKGRISLNFSVSISSRERDSVAAQRRKFVRDIQQAGIQQHISLSLDFHVELKEKDCIASYHFLVVSQVGSDNQQVLTCAAGQHVLPWVGVATDLNSRTSSEGGRMFCFLPMPEDAVAPLPVHINGTFGMNDDRRTVKWHSRERKNDPAAQWNKFIVGCLLPPCYKKFIYELIYNYKMAHDDVYRLWPSIDEMMGTDWESFIVPFLNLIFYDAVVWIKSTSKWVHMKQAILVPQKVQIQEFIFDVLSGCAAQIAIVPKHLHQAILRAKCPVTYLTHSIVRRLLRSNFKSYENLSYSNKLRLLDYCLSDEEYNDLIGLHLLPLASNDFDSFCTRSKSDVQPIYVCNSDYPKQLFISMDQHLVSLDDPIMMKVLNKVAKTKATQLCVLDHTTAVELIKKGFPLHWKGKSSVVIQKSDMIAEQWYETFWQWIQPHSLEGFDGDMVVPLSTASESKGLQVAKLSTQSSVIYLSNNCSTELMLALNKLPVYIASKKSHAYLHHKELQLYCNKLSPDGVLNAIHYGCNSKWELINAINFTTKDAYHLGMFLSTLDTPYCPIHVDVLINLPIFTAVNKDGLHAIKCASQMSWGNSGILYQDGFDISIENIPENLVLFSQDLHQLALLRNLSSHVKVQSQIQFVLNTICPMIQEQRFKPPSKINGIMMEVLNSLQLWKRKNSKEALPLISRLAHLQFVSTCVGRHDSMSRKCPHALYNCSNPQLKQILQDEPVFPVAPFNTKEILPTLVECGMMDTVSVQKLVEVVSTISVASGKCPQLTTCVKYNRAKAVLNYLCMLSTPDIVQFITRTKSYCWFPVVCEPKKRLTCTQDVQSYTYPEGVPWKGAQFKCHMIGASNEVFFPITDILDHSLMVGSQMYVIDCQLPQSVANMLTPSSYEMQVLAHLKVVIAHKDLIDTQSMTRTVQLIYQYLNDHCTPVVIASLDKFPPWIWLESGSAFVSPNNVAIKRNKTFSYDLAPYIYTLSENISFQFQTLLTKCRVPEVITTRQIVSVLEMMSKGRVNELTPDNAWQMVMTILNWLTGGGKMPLKDTEGGAIYVPIEGESDGYPQFADAESVVVYSDNKFLETVLAHSAEKYTYVLANERIGHQLAKSLGLTALSKHLDISEETFEDAGQHEPLTVRLKNILRDYKDGLTIIKELIQNADDAGATEINICFDTRCHATNSLFFEGMAESHGPALVVHNNATFTKEDFKNITKLAGATKQHDPLKIGKFGVGFCSVYHITDIPSFVSQDYFYVFDPTLKYLKDAVQSPFRPGKRLKFTQDILKSSRQLDPFIKLFGFDSNESYTGTIFRFPFRTSASEISNTIYDEHMIMEMVNSMEACSSELTLFLRHINRITFRKICPNDADMKILLDIKKHSEIPERSSSNVTLCKISSISAGVCTCSGWLVATSEPKVTEMPAISSAACSLEDCNGIYRIKPCKGEAFCFLPLGLKTGLPVHISANFAVINNRRAIWTDSNPSCPVTPEAQWNIHLMRTTIPEAYCSLLEALKRFQLHKELNDYLFHTLWPVKDNLEQQNPWNICVATLFSLLKSRTLFYSDSTRMWLTLEDSKFLASSLLSVSSSEEVLNHNMKTVVMELKLSVVDLPLQFQSELDLSRFIISEEKFLNIFFACKTLDKVYDARNAILFRVFQAFSVSEQNIQRQKVLENVLRSYPCVPCTPDGKNLKQCCNVIDPTSVFALMYDDDESMFPTKYIFSNSLAKTAMYSLGLCKDFIPWNFLIERANSIQAMYINNTVKATDRIQYIIKSIYKNLISGTDVINDQSHILASIPFLPVKHKPVNYPVSWCGEDNIFSCGKELVMPGTKDKYMTICRNELLCGSQIKILNDQWCTRCSSELDKVKDFLQVRAEPSCGEVLSHFKLLSHMYKKGDQNRLVESICRAVYGYFESCLLNKDVPMSSFGVSEVQELKTFPSVFVNGEFVNAEVVSQEWSLDGPYLYRIPETLITKKRLAFDCMNIQKQFSVDIVQKALVQMKIDFGSEPVSDQCKQVVLQILLILTNSVDEKSDGTMLLPDGSFVLHEARKLVYNDTPWCPTEKSLVFVHSSISRTIAEKLGVRSVRNERVDLYCTKEEHFGTDFGQSETLTQRIQNILMQYPLDVTILKELVQNADDAKATKMYVILDKRIHKGERVISKRWEKDLQGPAMLVWNDAVFTEEDLKGIQKLGLGSKRSDAEKIGMYGIGFNAVYHLTDCPSFISGGTTLCILDPHCLYAPGAYSEKPGRRFDGLTNGFWDDFKDMKPLYLLDGTENFPSLFQNEMKNGTLFRFPLRHTPELFKQSKIVPRVDPNGSDAMSADSLQKKISTWLPQIKQSLLFLSSVCEIKYCVIERDGKLKTLQYYKTVLTDDAKIKRRDFFGCVRTFGSDHFTPVTVSYSLELFESTIGQHKTSKTNWLIQQGVGDIYNEDQTWTYISQIKPRHDIAIPIEMTSGFLSQVFCFLPLPTMSYLPALINGHFVLNDYRRELWKPTTSDTADTKSKWNDNLFDAISSSYADFLMHSLEIGCIDRDHLDVSLDDYYKRFPDVLSDKLEGVWLKLALNVYQKLCKCNASVLAILKRTKSDASSSECIDSNMIAHLEWRKLKYSTDCLEKPYFLNIDHTHHAKCILSSQQSGGIMKPPSKLNMKQIFDVIGMTITCAPLNIIDWFHKAADLNLPTTTACNVFKHYAVFNTQVLLMNRTFPCKIEDTKFVSIDAFKHFLWYILVDHREGHCFVDSPCGLPVLLTADCWVRVYDEKDKIFSSKFSHLFPKSHHRFLHPELIELHITDNIFVLDSFDAVDDVLSQLLSCELLTVCVENSNCIIATDALKALWKCLTTDPVFKNSLHPICKKWALLQSNKNQLFSSQSDFLPIAVSGPEDQMSFQDVITVLHSIGMPFLESSWMMPLYFTTGLDCCPNVSNAEQMLAHLYHFELKFSTSFSNMELDQFRTLLKYISRINYKATEENKEHLKSLPLFQTILGDYVSIQGKETYIYPPNINPCGQEKWLKQSNVIFLDRCGAWRDYISESDLEIKNIRAEDVYVRYIFTCFFVLTEEERYIHLKHIRDSLFKECKLRVESPGENDAELLESSKIFCNSLRKLQCLGADGSELKVISEYCDHTINICKAFDEHFTLLPSYFLESAADEECWLDFFRLNGLNVSITKGQFYQFCSEVADGKNKDIRFASGTLLKYLFSKPAVEEWHMDATFLSKVSTIPFVCAQSVPELAWIQKVFQPKNQIKTATKTHAMTYLHGAYSSHTSFLVWTVCPLVELPLCEIGDMHSCTEAVKMKLGIHQNIDRKDVIRNIISISESSLSDASHFQRSSEKCKPPPSAFNLLEVMYASFKYFQSTPPGKAANVLESTPCIPVCRGFADRQIDKDIFILVRPSQVVANEHAKVFYPYLHPLPDRLYDCLTFLSTIGVRRDVEPYHMRLVLEMAFKSSEGLPLDANAMILAVKAVRLIYNKLKEIKSFELQYGFKPLYLPNQERKLVESTNLVYLDDAQYHKEDLDFTGSGLSLMHELQHTSEENKFDVHAFCNLLPNNVKPVPLSSCSYKKISFTSCELASPDVHRLRTILQAREVFDALKIVLKHVTKDDVSARHCFDEVIRSSSNVKVTGVENLHYDVVLKSSQRKIGAVRTRYAVNESDEECTLYIDYTGMQPLSQIWISTLAKRLSQWFIQRLNKVKNIDSTSKIPIQKFFSKLFKMNDISSIPDLLHIKFHIKYDTNMDITEIEPKHGQPIPESFHHRFDQDVHNIFLFEEWVGYEINSGLIVFAQVVRRVLQEPEDNGTYKTKYVIQISEDTSNEITVGALKLFKFLQGLSHPAMAESSAFVVQMAHSTSIKAETNSLTMKEILQNLCKELEEIWALPEQDRKLAIRRLYLKWHPDKNPHQVKLAEEVFKFLTRQLERLHANRPLENPSSDSTEQNDGGPNCSEYWQSHFAHWDRTAQQHQRSRQNDQAQNGEMPHNSVPKSQPQWQSTPRRAEGEQWIKQAQFDYQVLEVLSCHNVTMPCVCSHVCFMAYEVVYKALKGALLVKFGLSNQHQKHRNVVWFAEALEANVPVLVHRLSSNAAIVKGYEECTRFPSHCKGNIAPGSYFDAQCALEAKAAAAAVLAAVKEIL